MIEVVLNDRLGKKIRIKCNEDDTIGDLKKLVAAQTGTRPEKIRIQKWYTIYKDHITLEDYEVHDGMGLELYYNWVCLLLREKSKKEELKGRESEKDRENVRVVYRRFFN